MTKYLFVPLSIALVFLPLFSSTLTLDYYCPNLTRTLSFGSRGQDVVELQNFLIAQGDLEAGLNTGYFGRLTEAAVQSFQRRHGIASSGTAATTGYGAVGPRTRAKIAGVCGTTATTNTSFWASPTSGPAPLSVRFMAGILTGSGLYLVDFGDGTSGIPQGGYCPVGAEPCGASSVDHTYTQAGTYTAKLCVGPFSLPAGSPPPQPGCGSKTTLGAVTVTVTSGTMSNLSCTSNSQCPSTNYICEAISGYGTSCAYTSGGQPVDPNCSSTSVITQGVCKLKEGRSCSTSADCVTGTLCHAGICTNPVGKECFPTSGSNAPLCSEGYTCRKGCGPPVVSQYSEPEKYYCVLNEDTTFGTMCPICLAGSTLIDTPSGNVRVKDLRKGMSVWTTDSAFNRIEGVVTATSKVPVSNHTVVHLTLSDGRSVFVSAGHPTVDGRTVGELTAGDTYDGATITSVHRIAYVEEATYDLLPSGETGFYWADGVLLGSTLK